MKCCSCWGGNWGFSISGLSCVCESGRDKEKREGEVGERVGLCPCVGSFKKTNLFCSCRIYVSYLGDTQSRDSCQAGWEGELFSKLLNFQACQPAFNQIGVCHVGMCVMFWLLHQNFLSQKIKHLLQNWNWMALFHSSVCMTDHTGTEIRLRFLCIRDDSKRITKITGHTLVLLISHESNYSSSATWSCLGHFLC